MTKQLQEVQLGSKGCEFIRERLKGNGRIAEYVLGKVNETCRAISPLPNGVSSIQLQNLDDGGVTSRLDSWEWLGKRLIAKYERLGGCQVMLQDPIARNDDNVFPPQKTFARVCFEDSIYYIVDQHRIDGDSLLAATRGPISFHIIGYILAPPVLDLSVKAMDHNRIWKSAGEVLSAVQEVFVTAFDQEGLIIAPLSPT